MTLLNPEAWDDTNDSHFLSLYKGSRELSCLNAACFSESDETYHHWRVFANGSAGVRITFIKPLLEHCMRLNQGVRQGPVVYRTILDLKKGPKPAIDILPFLKRYPYVHEEEYRFLYESKVGPQQPTDIDIPLRCIRRITLSPWMAKPVSEAVKQTIRSLPGCARLSVVRSTLIGNAEWMAYGDAALSK